MWLLLEVECVSGEECISINEIDEDELDLLTPLLLRIQENNGWHHTGDFIETIDSNILYEYSGYDGFVLLEKLLPKPPGGIKIIARALLWDSEPMSLYMK